MENKIPIRFFVITFIWSWLFLFPLILIGNGIIPVEFDFLSVAGLPIIFLGALSPAVGAFFSIYTLKGKKALKQYFKTFLSLKFGWKAWTAIFLILGSSTFISWIIPEFWGEARLPMLLPNAYIFPIYLLLMIFIGGGQEEIGWRGYIMPILEKRFGLIFGSLILGIIWAVWHLPLWFIPGSTQIYMNVFAFILLCIGYSFIFSWMSELQNYQRIR